MSDQEGFAGAAEAMRGEVAAMVARVCAAVGDEPAAVQAVLLGALGGVIGCWAANILPEVTRARFLEAMSDTSADFAGQAFDSLSGRALEREEKSHPQTLSEQES